MVRFASKRDKREGVCVNIYALVTLVMVVL